MGNGNYRTMCSKTFTKKMWLNTLAADNTFPGICTTCKTYYDDMYISDLNDDPQMARNEVQMGYYDLPDWHHADIEGPKAKFEDTMDRRWGKLIRYQRQLGRRMMDRKKK
jgi:hypothetical protein